MKSISARDLGSSLESVLAQVADGEAFEIRDASGVIAVLSPSQHRASVALETVAEYSAGGRERITDTALTRLLGTASTRDVLGVFLLDAGARIHQREVARRADVGLRSAQIALQRLEELGLLRSQRDGNRRYYSVNRTRGFEELRGMLSKEFGLAKLLADALVPVSRRIERALVFGSTASGDDRVDSDVDLLIVGDVTGDELAPLIGQAERELGRDIEVRLYEPAEFRRRRDAGNHFITSVLAAPHIDIIGGDDDA